MQITRTQSKWKTKILKVGAYARVSTDKEDQEGSYETQVSYFSDLIQANPRWILVDIYADQGKSGLCALKRPGFMRMMNDALTGKLDLILVKSISRFARNSLEAQEYAHKLKGLGVEVRFEREGFSTFDAQSEMVFNFLTAIAEEGSKSISDNVRVTYARLAEQGIRHLGNNRVLGYDEIDGKLVPNDQAWIPKLIFEAYANGLPISAIIRSLKEKNARRMKSIKDFEAITINTILKNEIYVGDRQLQKAPHSDYKTKRPMPDTSYETFFIEEDHEGIVSRQVWDQVRARLETTKEQRSNGIHIKRHSHFLYGRIICGECGRPMTRKTERNHKKVWLCKDRKQGSKGSGCKNRIIREDQLLSSLAAASGFHWNGNDSTNEPPFADLITARIFKDGRIIPF